jgi:hypothetical protein
VEKRFYLIKIISKGRVKFMKKIFLTIFILISCFQLCISQDTKVQIDYKYFLLGTLRDYMGRPKYKEIDTQVDYYYKFEKSLALKIDSLFKSDYLDMKLIVEKDSSRYKIFSEKMADYINYFYDFKPSGSFTMSNNTEYYGVLKSNIFVNIVQKLSFITGAYVRYGKENDSLFCMTLANSVSIAKICVNLLKDLKCTNVAYNIQTNSVPVIHYIYFTPTDELKLYLNEIMYLRKKISMDEEEQFPSMR